MILAPNHLPLLNGNKFLFIFIVIQLTIGCNTSKPLVSTPSVPVPATPIPSTTKDEVLEKKDTIIAKDVKTNPSNSNPQDIKPSRLGTYKNPDGKHLVSVILPFYSNKYTDSTGNSIKSKYALDYYAGIKLALDSLQVENKIPLKVVFIDSKTSFDNFINSTDYKRSEIIVGPFEKENIRTISKMANNDNKILMLPFYPTEALEDIYMPNAYKMTIGIEEHCKAQFEHMKDHHFKSNVTFITKSSADSKSRLALFKSFDKNKQYIFKELSIDDSLTTLNKTNIENYIEEDEDNVFIVSSWDESFVLSALRKIENSARKNSITVYGLPQWLDFSQLPIELYQKLNVRISDVFLPSTNMESMKNFKNSFFEKYAAAPSEQSIQGYIAMNYIYEYIKSGKSFLPNKYSNLNSGYDFIEEMDANSQIKKKINRNIYIVKYEDYELIED